MKLMSKKPSRQTSSSNQGCPYFSQVPRKELAEYAHKPPEKKKHPGIRARDAKEDDNKE